jgi:hypothetical protein
MIYLMSSKELIVKLNLEKRLALLEEPELENPLSYWLFSEL